MLRNKQALTVLFIGMLMLSIGVIPGTAQVANVSVSANGMSFSPMQGTRAMVLTVSGNGRILRSEFADGSVGFFSPDLDGETLPNGSYTWELVGINVAVSIYPSQPAATAVFGNLGLIADVGYYRSEIDVIITPPPVPSAPWLAPLLIGCGLIAVARRALPLA